MQSGNILPKWHQCQPDTYLVSWGHTVLWVLDGGTTLVPPIHNSILFCILHGKPIQGRAARTNTAGERKAHDGVKGVP